MEKPFYRNPWIIAGLVFITSVVAFAGTVSAKLLLHEEQIDLKRKPPAQVFTDIFRIAPPKEVSEIKVVGESHLNGFFWMRLKVNDVDSVLTALKRNRTVPLIGPSRYMAGVITEKDLDNYPSAVEVGWQYALQIKQPEYYEFETSQSTTGWSGSVVVDRTYRLIYVQGRLL